MKHQIVCKPTDIIELVFNLAVIDGAVVIHIGCEVVIKFRDAKQATLKCVIDLFERYIYVVKPRIMPWYTSSNC